MGNLEQREDFDRWLEETGVAGQSSAMKAEPAAPVIELKEVRGEKVVAEFGHDGTVRFNGVERVPFGRGRLFENTGEINQHNEDLEHAISEGWVVIDEGSVFLTEAGQREYFGEIGCFFKGGESGSKDRRLKNNAGSSL